jgi:uncharacterized protein (DUF305 family)
VRRLALFLAAVTVGVAACGGGDENGQLPGGEATVSGEVPFDQAFIDAMVPHHRAAIEMAQEALDAGLSEPELVNIADSIITAQQIEIDQMLNWRERWFGSNQPGPPETALEILGLSAAEAGMGHEGADFSSAENVDQAFAEMMIAHHEGAVRMAELARERAAHEEITKLADEIIAAQQREIDAMEAHAEDVHH